MAAPELENRPSSAGETALLPNNEIVQHPDVAEVAAELGQYLKPTATPQPQAVTDDKGQPILIPTGMPTSENMVPYTAAQIKTAQKKPITDARHWLAVFYGLILKRLRVFGKLII